MRRLMRIPRLIHRADDHTTVQPSERSAASELLASVRATADAVAVGERALAESPRHAESDVRDLADTLRDASTCDACRKGKSH